MTRCSLGWRAVSNSGLGSSTPRAVDTITSEANEVVDRAACPTVMPSDRLESSARPDAGCTYQTPLLLIPVLAGSEGFPGLPCIRMLIRGQVTFPATEPGKQDCQHERHSQGRVKRGQIRNDISTANGILAARSCTMVSGSMPSPQWRSLAASHSGPRPNAKRRCTRLWGRMTIPVAKRDSSAFEWSRGGRSARGGITETRIALGATVFPPLVCLGTLPISSHGVTLFEARHSNGKDEPSRLTGCRKTKAEASAQCRMPMRRRRHLTSTRLIF